MFQDTLHEDAADVDICTLHLKLLATENSLVLDFLYPSSLRFSRVVIIATFVDIFVVFSRPDRLLLPVIVFRRGMLLKCCLKFGDFAQDRRKMSSELVLLQVKLSLY